MVPGCHIDRGPGDWLELLCQNGMNAGTARAGKAAAGLKLEPEKMRIDRTLIAGSTWGILSLTLFLGGTPALAGIPAEVHTLDAVVHEGELVTMDPVGELTLLRDEERNTIPLERVHMIRFTAATNLRPEDAADSEPYSAGILLAGGDYLTGSLAGGDTDFVAWSHPLLGRLQLSIDALRILLPGKPDIPAGFGRFDLSTGEDVVYRARDKVSGDDFISGTVDSFSGTGLAFDCSLGLVDFTFEQLEAVVIAGDGPSTDESGAGGVIVLLRGGSGRLSGIVESFGGDRLRLACRCGLEVSIPVAAIDSIAFRRETWTFLSDLEPAEVAETPYLGSAEDFLYPFQGDRSVTGRELSCGGMRFAKGLGVHARCSLTYELDGGYKAFHAFAGISDEVLTLKAKGSIVFRVLVDGRKVFESPRRRGGDGVLALPLIPLEGAGRLTLEADFADGFDSGDRGLWGQPILVR